MPRSAPRVRRRGRAAAIAWATGLAATWAVAATAGCSGANGGGMASIDSPGDRGQAQAQTRPGQPAVAEAMAGCLQAEGIAAELKELGDQAGQVEVWIEDGPDFWQLCDQDGCLAGGGIGLAAREFEAATALAQSIAADREAGQTGGGAVKPWLIIGGEDLSQQWQQCAGRTGYQRPTWVQDPSEELTDKRRIADAGTDWAACARRHGHPETKDPSAPVADGWATEPTAVLPAEITPEQFAALLEACPAFDFAAQAAADEALAANPDMADAEYWALAPAEPAIGFDVPCQDGSAAVCDEATWAKYNPLHQLVQDQRSGYLESHGGDEDQ